MKIDVFLKDGHFGLVSNQRIFGETKMGRRELVTKEIEILDSFEKNQWDAQESRSVAASRQPVAPMTVKTDKRVNVYISEQDLALLQERALGEGMTCQTLMSSILHEYVIDYLAEEGA